MSTNKKFHKIKKPIDSFYSDYIIQNGECFAIFEKNNGRVEVKKVCKTTKTNNDWREFSVKETKQYLFINLGD